MTITERKIMKMKLNIPSFILVISHDQKVSTGSRWNNLRNMAAITANTI